MNIFMDKSWVAKASEKTPQFRSVLCIYLSTLEIKQESLANAKVNARQHCVSLSCLCNSLTQIEWVADFSLGDEDSENTSSKRYKNRHLRRPFSCLTPHISRTPANICITLILLESTFTGLHFRCWQCGSICIQIFVVGPNTRNHAKFWENSTLQQFKVIQGQFRRDLWR